MDYSKIIKDTLKNNGGSFNVSKSKIKKPLNGFMCSIKDLIVIDKKDFNVKLLKYLVKQNFNLLKENENFIGTWIDGGKVYIDISANFKNKNEALQVAEENKQLAIFDLQKMESIYLK